jgi:hypothetical protein
MFYIYQLSLFSIEAKSKVFSASPNDVIVTDQYAKLFVHNDVEITTNGNAVRVFRSYGGSSLILGSNLQFHGIFNRLIWAKTSQVELRSATITLDSSNAITGGYANYVIYLQSSDIEVQSSTINITDLTRGIYAIASRFSIVESDIYLNGILQPIALTENTFVDINSGSSVTITNSTGGADNPAVIISSMSSVLNDGDGASLTIEASNSTCMSVRRGSSFTQTAACTLSLFCGVYEFEVTDLSRVIIQRDSGGTNVVLQPGTINQTLLQSVLYNTSTLIGTPDTTYTDAGAQFRYSA